MSEIISSESEGEDEELEKLNSWMSENDLSIGIVGFDHSDPITGQQKAIFDLAWPNGIQEELSQPVAVLLNEDSETISQASEAGFRCFTNVDSFKRYVTSEVLIDKV